MKSLDPNLKEPPPIDNKQKCGPSNPSNQGGQQGVRVPMFRFELNCMPPGHPSPLPIDGEELNDFDIVYYYTSYDNAIISALRGSDHELESGPTCLLAQGGQPIASVEPSLQPQQSPTSLPPLDVEQLHDNDGEDDDNEENHEDVDKNDNAISSPPDFDLVELDSDDVEEEDYFTYDDDDDQDDGIDDLEPAEADNDVDSLQPQESPPHGPVVVILSDSDDDEAENDNEDVEVDNDDDNEEGADAAGDDNVFISSPSPTDFGQASSSRRAQGRTPLIDSESVEIIDNHWRNQRSVDSQPPVNIQDLNVHLVGTRSSMAMAISSRTQGNPATDVEPVETSLRKQKRRLDVDPQPPFANFEGASSSMLHVEPVGPLPSPPPPPPPPAVPAYTCPICLGPMVDETMSTKCGHLFCDGCIRSAISIQAKCPICRRRINHRELLRVFFPSPI